MMKYLKVKISLLFCFALLFSNVSYGYAATIDTTSTPILKSTKVPSSYIDLSYGTILAFDVTELTYGNLFTNYGFTGVSAVEVNVDSITVDKNGSADTIKDLTITLHKKGSTSDLASEDVGTSGGTVYFSNLSTTTKYYLEFSKTNDGQYFSFDGSISDYSD